MCKNVAHLHPDWQLVARPVAHVSVLGLTFLYVDVTLGCGCQIFDHSLKRWLGNLRSTPKVMSTRTDDTYFSSQESGTRTVLRLEHKTKIELQSNVIYHVLELCVVLFVQLDAHQSTAPSHREWCRTG